MASSKKRAKRPARARRSDATHSDAVAKRKQQARNAIVGKVVAVAVLLALCVVAAFAVGTADYAASIVGWLPLLTVVTAIVLAFLYLRLVAGGLSIEQRTMQSSCKRGDNVAYRVRFKNRRPLFLFRIEARIFIADMDGKPITESTTTLALAPFEENTLDFSVRFDHIGTYSAGLYEVVVCDFLRLFTRTIELTQRNEVQVTPRLTPIARIDFSNDASLESTRAHRSVLADSLDYAMVRDYVPGDPLKTIHWKLSARSDHYYTRVFEVHNDPGVAVVMDFYAPETRMRLRMGMFDAVVESAFSLAQFARGQGMDTEVHYVTRHGERKRRISWSDEEAADIVGELPRMSDEPALAGQALDLLRSIIMSQRAQNNIVYCTASLSAEMIALLIDAKTRKLNPILIAVVPSDLLDRDRDDYLAPLARLDDADIGYVALARSDELRGVNA